MSKGVRIILGKPTETAFKQLGVEARLTAGEPV